MFEFLSKVISFLHYPMNFATAKVAIAEFFWKMHRKTWYSILGVDAVPLYLKKLFLIRSAKGGVLIIYQNISCS
jgi:hypothetical protein